MREFVIVKLLLSIGESMDNNDELQVQIQYALVEKLSNSNRRQAKLLAILDECIFECDKHLNLTYINEAWEKKLGYSSDSLIGSNITKLMNCDDIMHFVAYSCCLLEGKQTPSVEIQIKNSHGLLNWFELRLVYDEKSGFIGSLYDIQRHKDSQLLLTQQQKYVKRLSLVASHTNNLVIITDKFGVIEWVNNSFEVLTGYTCDEVIGTSPGHLLQGPKTCEKSRKVMSHAVKSGLPFQVETTNYDKNGNIYWVAIDANPVRDDEGQVKHFIAIETNITQRVKAEQAMAEIEYNYHSVVDNIPDIVLRLDTFGNLLFINQAWQRVLHSKVDESLGLPIIKFIAKEDVEKISSTLLDYKQGKRDIRRFDIRLINAQGINNWVEITLTPIVGGYESDLSSIAATLVDIQERIESEQILLEAKHQAETLAESKSRFMANISHEIRTPLNAVIGSADILHHTGLTSEQMRYTQMIKTSSDALLSVLDDVLTYSRFEAQAITLNNQPFSIDTCIEEAIDIISQSALQKGLEVIFDFYPDVPAQVIGDHARIRQIVINLLANAIKFTQHGVITVTVKCTHIEGNNLNLYISVKDTGMGIAKNKIDSMFMPFIQSDNSITRKHGGSGLGLAICRQICDVVGGDISVSSEFNKGSEFIVNYPLQIDTTDSILREGFAARSKKPKVWIVGNHEILKTALEHTLTRFSITFEHFEVCPDIPKYDSFPDAIVLTDPQMLAQTRERINTYNSLNSPCLLILDLLGKSLLPQNINDRELRLNGPYKVSHVLRAISLLEEQLFHLDIIFTNREQKETLESPLGLNQLSGTKVLVAEDNTNNQIVIRQFLEQKGCRVHIVSDGQEGIIKAQSVEIDIIFMDIQMPILDGISATKAIRKLGITTPIIALTANAIHGDKERFIDAGMNDYLAKPIVSETLYLLLDKYAPEQVIESKHLKLSRLAQVWEKLS